MTTNTLHETSMPSTAHTPRAYSYVRFSTPQQALGDSLARQAAKAARWATEHGLTLQKMGVSGDAKALPQDIKAIVDHTM